MTSDKLVFFAFSADKPVGDGVSEYVIDVSVYERLNIIPNWRRKLSSITITPFEYKRKLFNTLDHAMQYVKFNLCGYKKIARQFSLNSNSDISIGDGRLANKNRKLVILSRENIILWDSLKREIKYKITLAKFTTNEECKNILMYTLNSQLWNQGPRISKTRCTTLEKVRESLNL